MGLTRPGKVGGVIGPGRGTGMLPLAGLACVGGALPAFDPLPVAPPELDEPEFPCEFFPPLPLGPRCE